MFLRNYWYVAGYGHEVTDNLLARRILDEPIVFFRNKEGNVSALEDRCPHRLAPLSLGRAIDHEVECGYHGARFGADGQCTLIPSQPEARIPKAACVRSYPTLERDKYIWIWMGDPEKADPSKILDISANVDPKRSFVCGMSTQQAHYQLISDNILDLSHVGVVHRTTLGNDASNTAKVETTIEGESVQVNRWVEDADPVPAWGMATGYTDKVDHWMEVYWEAPGNMLLEIGITPTGKTREEGFGFTGTGLLTPETKWSTHYFWSNARTYNVDDPELDEMWTKAMQFAFEEDRVIIEGQQALIGENVLLEEVDAPVSFQSDKAGLGARKIMKRLLQEQ